VDFTSRYLNALGKKRRGKLNSELCKQALAKVGSPNVLVNIISRRVRQLNSGGQSGRPLVLDIAGLGAADIALKEIIDGKLGWILLEAAEGESRPPAKKRKKS
jgi:DNA-directed RNA polymerase subunit omega